MPHSPEKIKKEIVKIMKEIRDNKEHSEDKNKGK